LLKMRKVYGSSKPKICYVSTSSDVHLCGIATYTHYLEQEVRKRFNTYVTGRWEIGSRFFPFRIFAEVVAENPNLVHVQWEYMMFGPAQVSFFFPLLLLFLKFYRKPTVLTMHSVIPTQTLDAVFFESYGAGRRFFYLKKLIVLLFTRVVEKLSDVIIVHSEISRDTLLRQYHIPGYKVSVIPHPIIGEKPRPKEESDYFTIMHFGFVKESKGIHHVLNVLPKIVERFPRVRFIVVGAVRNISRERNYAISLRRIVRDKKLESYVSFIDHFVPFEQLPSVLSQADVYVLLYTEKLLSDSGALKTVLPYGRPILATSLRCFEKLADNLLLINPEHLEQELIDKLLRIIEDDQFAKKYGEKCMEIVDQYSLEKIARATEQIYLNLLK